MRQVISVSDRVEAAGRTQADPQIARWIRRTLAEDPPRARSLIVTIWGDALAPHGGQVWLAGLIRLLEPFGVNDRLTRTSVFRLARDGWLSRETRGRQSRYRLTAAGRARFAAAYRRIYAPPPLDWHGAWEMIVDLPGSDAAARAGLREDLRWAGYGALAAGVFVRPIVGGEAQAGESAAPPDALRLLVHDAKPPGEATLARQAGALWDFAAIARDYRRYLARFGRVIDRFRMRPIEASDPAQCFIVRTLLIHAYRRTLLRDPRLPPTLLPLDWPGNAAYALTRDFYRLTRARAEAHLAATLTADGSALAAADDAFHARFGGVTTP